jgi:hypothetical protein
LNATFARIVNVPQPEDSKRKLEALSRNLTHRVVECRMKNVCNETDPIQIFWTAD